MKKILNILMAALVLTGISCSEDLEYKPGGVTPVQTLLLPADNYYVELQSASTATLRFSWEPALAADGQLPHYEVVFFGKPGGEIVYRCDAGSSTSVDIVHKEINRIANAAGIDVGADGAVYWSVVSSRGVAKPPRAAAILRMPVSAAGPATASLPSISSSKPARALRSSARRATTARPIRSSTAC